MELEKNRQDRLSILLAEPNLADQQDISLLEDLTRLYPYFQPLHLLSAKANTTDERSRNRAAFYTNGSLLHKVLEQQEWPLQRDIELIGAVPQSNPEEEEEEEIFEEISELNVEDFRTAAHQPPPAQDDPSSRIETIEDDFVLEGMSVDFFAFEEKFAPEDSREEVAPPADVQPEETVTVSNYHDDTLPYTFLWWLAKTRKEHQSIFQPYASPKKSNNPGELQQQYVEHIFHLQSPFDADEVTSNTIQAKPIDHKETEIIDNFLKKDPQISPPKAEQIDNENKAKKSAEDHNDLVSETLAKIYIEQMLYHKAIDTYQKLSLKFPEKSRYFADLIQSLEKKI
ncbi:hypothetical protein DBR11_08285 [Pedobacter sp. HMWF019]|uniref:hypothetical protein n=1 Tax=Pedobacter sp. HMWF019 TaxID=2056856 RepID=UPI000D3972C9|nr:hypothetical protein [Pedobacter sp. HMWF019]PTT01026.1 hypothetical protein DBR11_08285 [Pedobacter sp. HMWF019]